MTDRERLFHLVLPAAWDASSARARGTLDSASLAAEGFVHLSFRGQLAGTLAVHFATHKRALLFEVELPQGTPELKLEPSRDKALFPHLYRSLRVDELRRQWDLKQSPSGWILPGLGHSPEADRPQGRDPFASGED